MIERCIDCINNDKSPSTIPWTKDEMPLFKSLQLLSAIPVVYILNTSNEEAAKGNHYTKEVAAYLNTPNYVVMSQRWSRRAFCLTTTCPKRSIWSSTA